MGHGSNSLHRISANSTVSEMVVVVVVLFEDRLQCALSGGDKR